MTSPPANTWRFPRAFWVAKVIELFERAAYYGVFIALAVFLTNVVGFTDIQAGWVGASFAGLIYLLPFVTGAISDRIGFRPAYAQAHIIWFVFATVGALAFAALMILQRTSRSA
jgi:dipeptide/tripeptide permease